MFTLFGRKKQKKRASEWKRTTIPRIATVEIGGRRHMTGVPYALPKDLAEVNRLDFQHYIYRSILKGNSLVPLEKPGRILDVAAGTSIWGKEMAQQFPHAQIIGFDLEEVKISGPMLPNYQFVRGNLLDGLPFADNSFDLVHQRLVLASAVPFERWMDLFRELLRVTMPGGWLELPEMGVEVHPSGPLTEQFFAWGIEASRPRGLYPREIPRLGRYLLEAGGRQVKEQFYDVPMGSWGGRLGTMMETNLLSAFGGLKALYTERGDAGEFDRLLSQLPAEWARLRSHIRLFVFCCQKGVACGR